MQYGKAKYLIVFFRQRICFDPRFLMVKTHQQKTFDLNLACFRLGYS